MTALNREAARKLLDWSDLDRVEMEEMLDALEECIEGVVLTTEEAAYAARWLPTKNSQRARDLAQRLTAEREDLTSN